MDDEKDIENIEAAREAGSKDRTERVRRVKRAGESKGIAEAGDEVPFAWRTPLVVLDKRFKMTRVLRTIKQGDLERSHYLPARSEE